MSLKDKRIKSEYRTLIDNVVQDFYIPLLHEATSYKRAVGFFSSSSLVEISKGIADMAKDGGRIEIVASPYLSDEDIQAIKEGYENRQKIIEGALIRQLSDEHEDYYSMERLNLLAHLISEGILDIRIAYTDKDNDIGMYHEKMGILEDKDGNHVAFSGSMNESMTAMSINYETIDVFCDWKEAEADRVKLKENAFYSMWNNVEPSLKVLEFPKISDVLIEKYRKKAPNFDIDYEQFKERKPAYGTMLCESGALYGGPVGARIPDDVGLHEYQKEAIANWVGENYRGIFDMATGTGKTYTGLGAISKLSEDINDDLAVIIVAPYKHLVEQWVEDIVKFNMKPIIAYGDPTYKDWRKRFSKAITDQKIRKDKRFFCVVTTNVTFASPDFQEKIDKIKSPILLVVDEAHNFGARSYASLWILQNIGRAQATQRPTVYYPVHKKEGYFTMYPILKENGYLNSDIWTDQEVRRLIQERLGCSINQAEVIIQQSMPIESLDTVYEMFLKNIERDEIQDDVFENISENEIQDDAFGNINSDAFYWNDDVYEKIEQRALREMLERLMGELKNREQEVLKARYGFEDGVEKTLEEVGQRFGVTRERVRQIEAKAIGKLSNPTKLRKLKGFLSLGV